MDMTLFWTVVQALNQGFVQTLKLFAVTLVCAAPLGLVVSFGSMSRFAPPALADPDGGVGHPGHPLDAPAHHHFLWAECGLTITSGGQPDGRLRGGLCDQLRCYFSVIYRGGIQGVPLGQREAAQVLGFTRRQIFFKVTLLQMIKRIVPPMSNEIITGEGHLPGPDHRHHRAHQGR